MDCWHHEIDTATSEGEVVRNAGEYLLLWAPRELSAETLGLTRMRIENAGDVERVNDRLALTALPASRTPQSAHVREIAKYFRHAAMRLAELRPVALRTPERNQFQPSL